MSSVVPALLQVAALGRLLALTVPPLARYLAHVYTSPRHLAGERLVYRLAGVDPDADQHWRAYLTSVLGFSLVGVLVLYAFGRLQQHLPLSLGMAALPADGAFNTAVSFVTNTNWQWYSGEAALGHLMQMSGLTVQNFVSAAVGMAVAVALARGLARSSAQGRGRQLLGRPGPRRRPRAAADRVVGGARARRPRRRPEPRRPHVVGTLADGSQTLTGGPVASQEAIKELGTNGGGFYNANSAHPFENPSPLSNLLEIYLHPAHPAGDGVAFGRIVGDRRQGARSSR